jgi:hypothetical protein
MKKKKKKIPWLVTLDVEGCDGSLRSGSDAETI